MSPHLIQLHFKAAPKSFKLLISSDGGELCLSDSELGRLQQPVAQPGTGRRWTLVLMSATSPCSFGTLWGWSASGHASPQHGHTRTRPRERPASSVQTCLSCRTFRAEEEEEKKASAGVSELSSDLNFAFCNLHPGPSFLPPFHCCHRNQSGCGENPISPG